MKTILSCGVALSVMLLAGAVRAEEQGDLVALQNKVSALEEKVASLETKIDEVSENNKKTETKMQEELQKFATTNDEKDKKVYEKFDEMRDYLEVRIFDEVNELKRKLEESAEKKPAE